VPKLQRCVQGMVVFRSPVKKIAFTSCFSSLFSPFCPSVRKLHNGYNKDALAHRCFRPRTKCLFFFPVCVREREWPPQVRELCACIFKTLFTSSLASSLPRPNVSRCDRISQCHRLGISLPLPWSFSGFLNQAFPPATFPAGHFPPSRA